MDTATTLVEALGGWDNISNLEACIKIGRAHV